MNIATHLKTIILERLAENKRGYKAYKTEAAAEKAAEAVAAEVGKCHMTSPAHYLILEVEGIGFVPCINTSEVLRRPDACGGYVGHAAQAGFVQY